MEHRLKSVAIMTLRERYFGFLQRNVKQKHTKICRRIVSN